MEPEIIRLQDKRTEQSLVSISAKLADAVEMLQITKEMTGTSAQMLIKAQLELEELYLLQNRGIDTTGKQPELTSSEKEIL